MVPSEYSLLLFSILWEGHEEICRAVRDVLDPQNYSFKEMELDLPSVYMNEPTRGASVPIRAVLFRSAAATFQPMEVFIANAQDGWPTLLNCVITRSGARLMRAVISKETREFPRNRFELTEHGEVVRVVQAMKDGDEWDFYQRGLPQPFEDLSSYKKRCKKDRLTAEMVKRYLLACGVDIEDPLFWRSEHPAFYITQQMRG